MAQTNQSSAGGRRENPMSLSIEACKNDDVFLMERAMSAASHAGSRHSANDILQHSVKRAAARRSLNVLRYVLDQGADVSKLAASDLMFKDYPLEPSQDVLEMLVAHGWDVNSQGPSGDDRPLLWQVVQYSHSVKWCLNHGAHVDVPDEPSNVNADGTQSRSHLPRPTILGAAAASGTVEIFEMLRAKAAPLDPRTLHLAVEHAAIAAPKANGERSETYVRRMNMVRHLLDELRLDVNAVASRVGSQCSTPLCCVAARNSSQDFKELIFLLLDHSAQVRVEEITLAAGHLRDPMTCAESSGNARFLEVVREWREQRTARTTD